MQNDILSLAAQKYMLEQNEQKQQLFHQALASVENRKAVVLPYPNAELRDQPLRALENVLPANRITRLQDNYTAIGSSDASAFHDMASNTYLFVCSAAVFLAEAGFNITLEQYAAILRGIDFTNFHRAINDALQYPAPLLNIEPLKLNSQERQKLPIIGACAIIESGLLLMGAMRNAAFYDRRSAQEIVDMMLWWGHILRLTSILKLPDIENRNLSETQGARARKLGRTEDDSLAIIMEIANERLTQPDGYRYLHGSRPNVSKLATYVAKQLQEKHNVELTVERLQRDYLTPLLKAQKLFIPTPKKFD